VFCHEAVPALIPTPPELRDPDDVHVLACAVGAHYHGRQRSAGSPVL
jgi:hypothetical protein